MILLAHEGPNWPYAYMQMNNAMAHVPLSIEGHIGVMTDGLPSTNACGCLDQLQVWKILQCGGQVVCPEGLNGSLKAMLFNFEELPLWNVATVNEPTQDPPLIEVDLNSMEPEAPFSTGIEDPLSLNLRGALEQLWQASPATPSSPSQYITSRIQLPSVALGAPSPAGETENSPRPMGTEPVIPTLVLTLP